MSGYGYKGHGFLSQGNNFVYADNPEQICVGRYDMHYQWGCSISTTPKDFELYNHLTKNPYDKKESYNIQIGIAVANLNSTPVSINYKFASGLLDIPGGATDILPVTHTPDTLKRFFNANADNLCVIPAGGKKVVVSVTTTVKNAYTRFCTLRAQLKSSLPSNVWARVFIAGETKINDLEDLFGSNKTLLPAADAKTFTGELDYSQKYTEFDANTTDEYRLFEWVKDDPNYNWFVNGNEYERVLTCKEHGNPKHGANYGVIYKMRIKNATGKTLTLKPVWTFDDVRMKASVLYRLNNGAWTVGPILERQDDGYWTFQLGYSSTATLEVVLPGGNCANYQVAFR